ncbi:MAG: hypothetical protein AB7E80_12205 [Hyphomicrobiaceae bacterium]
MAGEPIFSVLSLWPGLLMAIGALALALWIVRFQPGERTLADRLGGNAEPGSPADR